MTDLKTKLLEADGGSRELDAEIYVTLFGGEVRPEYYRKGLAGEEFEALTGVSPVQTEDGWKHRKAPAYTTSLDAALALVADVLPGWFFDMGHNYGTNEIQHGVFEGGELRYELNHPPFLAELISPTGGHFETGHKSPAIAVCLALLSALEKEPDQ
jgi:hypothetical protein